MTRNLGFTLMELLVSIAVLAIVTTVAAPSFAGFLRDQRATAQANDLLISLTYARSEAVKRGTTVTVCTSSDGEECDAGAGWSAGWIVFVDTEGAGPDGVLDPGDTFLRVHDPAGAMTIQAAADRRWVGFNAQGMAVARDDFTIEPSGCTGNQARSLDMSLTGRARVSEASC